MQLTIQMLAEIQNIKERKTEIVETKLLPKMKQLVSQYCYPLEDYTADLTELNNHKVRLENILCETDNKERGHFS